MPERVHIGVVEHKHGYEYFAGATDAALTRELAKWCRENWNHAEHGDPPQEDWAVVDVYFDDNADEFLLRDETEVAR